MTNQVTITDELKTVASMIDVARKALDEGSGFDLNDVYGRNQAAVGVLDSVSDKLGVMIEEK